MARHGENIRKRAVDAGRGDTGCIVKKRKNTFPCTAGAMRR